VSVTLLQGGRRRAVCTSDTEGGNAEEEGEELKRGGGCEVGETDAARGDRTTEDRATAQVQHLLLGLCSFAVTHEWRHWCQFCFTSRQQLPVLFGVVGLTRCKRNLSGNKLCQFVTKSVSLEPSVPELAGRSTLLCYLSGSVIDLNCYGRSPFSHLSHRNPNPNPS